MIVPLMDDGRPYFEVDGNTIKINREGVYRFGLGPASEFTSGRVVEVSDDGTDSDTLLNDLFDPDPCRLDHDGYCQQHGWFNSDRPCPMDRVRRHFGWPSEHNPFIAKPLDAVYSMRANEHGEEVRLDSRAVEIASDTRTQIVSEDGPYPAVWVTQHSGHDVRVRVDRYSGPHGPIVEVWAYGDSGTTPDGEEALRTAGRRAHIQANRLDAVARSMLPAGGATFLALCDVVVKLREMARDVCGVPYTEPAEPIDPNAGVPWPLREWALLARQTLEQQALQLSGIEAWQGLGRHTMELVRAHAVKMMLQAVAEYPDDLDAVQAEQATRNADDEAVRRLAHAMTEVANTLGTFPASTDDRLVNCVRKLRETVNTWTTEDQRRQWARVVRGRVVVGIDPATAHSDGGIVEGERSADGVHLRVTSEREPGINPVTGEGLERVGVDRGPVAFTVPDDIAEGHNTVPAPARAPHSETSPVDWDLIQQAAGEQDVTADEVHELLDKAHQAIGSAVQDLEALAHNVSPHLVEWVRNIIIRLTAYPVTDKLPQAPNPEAEKLARTMQAAATGLEVAYRPGRPPYVVANVIKHLRADSAGCISDAEKAHSGETADTANITRTHQGHAGCDHAIEIHGHNGCQVDECPCTATCERLRDYWNDERQQAHPLEAEAVQGPRGDVTPADLPGSLVNTLHGLVSFLDRGRGRWPMEDAAKAALWRYNLRQFLGLA